MKELKCPHCFNGHLVYVSENFPYSLKHLQCVECDSTFNFFDDRLLEYSGMTEQELIQWAKENTYEDN